MSNIKPMRVRSIADQLNVVARQSVLQNPQNPYIALKKSESNEFLSTRSLTKGSKVNLLKNNQIKLPPLKGEDKSETSSKLDIVEALEKKEPIKPTTDPKQDQVQIGYFKLQQQWEMQNKFAKITEKFFKECYLKPLHEALEQTLIPVFKAATVTFWQDIPSIHLLYSPRLQVTVSHSDGLVGYTFFTRKFLKIERACSHSAYKEGVDSKICPGQTPVYIFPLWDYNDNVCAVVEVTRTSKDPFFDAENDAFIQFFSEQFKIHSKWLFPVEIPHSLIIELGQVMELEQFLLLFQKRIHTFFNCRIAEIWRYNIRTNKMDRFINDRKDIDPGRAGIVGDAFSRECTINVQNTKMQSSYIQYLDGDSEESALIVPIIDTRLAMKWAVCLRGSKNFPVFTSADEELLGLMTPYLALSLENADKYSSALLGNARESLEHHCVFGLQKIASLINEAAETKVILNEALENIEKLTSADRVLLFQYDKDTDNYVVSAYIGSKDPPNPISKDHGIVGKTFNSKEIINLTEAYEDPNFDNAIDLQTQYKTKTLLSVPVMNNRLEVIAVLQMINRKDGQPFSQTDFNYMKIFSIMFGLLLDNQQMYSVSTSANRQLSSFISVSTALSSNQNVKQILSEILQNARVTINAERSSLFLLDNVVNTLTSYLVDGGKMPQSIPLSHGIAATAVKQKISIVIQDAYHDPRFNKMIDFHTGFKTKSLIAVPVITSDGTVIGVAEMLNKQEGIFTQSDQTLLESFSTFAALLLEKRRLKDITEKGTAQIEMSKWIGEFERSSYTTPTKLRVPEAKQDVLKSLDFFAIDWNGIGLFQIAFFVFNDFGLLERFQITNDLFFTFLYRLREAYNEPPYHNWIHAIDVLQYISYQVRITNSHKILTQFELLAVCVAALCHDAGHQGLNNAFNVNAETPLGILFKDQSVMETFHCTVAIRILSQPETNLFHSLNTKELTVIWKWIIHLILATDMAFHFKLIKQGNEALEAGVINLKEEAHRLMCMELVMKVSDISNVSRPFKYADKWCEVLSEEFWRQGDKEKELGLPYSGPLMNREGQNKPKGQVGFYNFVCLPLYTLIARIFPELTVNLESVKSNLAQWVKLVEEQEKAQAAQASSNNDAKPESNSPPPVETARKDEK